MTEQALHERSLGARFSVFIGALLLPLFLLTGAGILFVQDLSFSKMEEEFQETFSTVREFSLKAAKSEDAAKIEKLGKLLAAIAPAAIASYDFTSLIEYGKTAVETPGVCEIIYKTPEGKEIVRATSADKCDECIAQDFLIMHEGAKMGIVSVSYHDKLLQKKISDMDAQFKERQGSFSEEQDRAFLMMATSIAACLFIVAALALGLVIFLFKKFVATPLHGSVRVMEALTQGRLNIDVPYTGRGDEIGSIAKALEVFKRNAVEREELRAKEKEKEEVERQRVQKITKISTDFDVKVGKIVDFVATAAGQVQANASGLSARASQTNALSATVASATSEASANVQSVASAVEELSASISEINRQIGETSRIAGDAVDRVKRTDETVSTLSAAAIQIGDVVKLIQNIAEQTNLLALNATIEAARAGEAGKGFAVVAGEVKNLANQTGRATEEISQKIVTVQEVSEKTVVAIRDIGGTIESISKISTDVSAAVRQQEAATKEIAGNVVQASNKTNQVSSNVYSVTEAAKESKDAAAELLGSADDLTRQASALRNEIQSFLRAIRG